MTEPMSPNKLKRKSRKFRGKRYDKKLCFVYGLIDAYGRVGYIGQTRTSLAKRLKYHFKDAANGKTEVHKWIQSTHGVDIFMVDSNATWDVSEILYIDRYRRAGHNLTNMVRGGSDTIHAVQRETSLAPHAHPPQS